MYGAPIVYLDTQDFSRFGDILRGKGDAAAEKIFNALESIKKSGDAIFVASMPLLGELLQYNANFRETTLRKAEAVERLCGGWALFYPSRLVAAEIAMAAQRLGLVSNSANISVLSSDRYWYPNIADTFDGLNKNMQRSLENEISEIPSRAARRQLSKRTRKINLTQVANGLVPIFAEKYGLPDEVIKESIIKYLSKKITAAEASKIFFPISLFRFDLSIFISKK